MVSVKMDPECTSAKDFQILCEHDPFQVDYVKRWARKHFRDSGAIGEVPRGVKPGDYVKVASTGKKLDWNSWIGSHDDHEQVNQEFLDGNDDEPMKMEGARHNIHKLTDGCTMSYDGYEDPLPWLQLIYVWSFDADHVVVTEAGIHYM